MSRMYQANPKEYERWFRENISWLRTWLEPKNTLATWDWRYKWDGPYGTWTNQMQIFKEVRYHSQTAADNLPYMLLVESHIHSILWHLVFGSSHGLNKKFHNQYMYEPRYTNGFVYMTGRLPVREDKVVVRYLAGNGVSRYMELHNNAVQGATFILTECGLEIPNQGYRSDYKGNTAEGN